MHFPGASFLSYPADNISRTFCQQRVTKINRADFNSMHNAMIISNKSCVLPDTGRLMPGTILVLLFQYFTLQYDRLYLIFLIQENHVRDLAGGDAAVILVASDLLSRVDGCAFDCGG